MDDCGRRLGLSGGFQDAVPEPPPLPEIPASAVPESVLERLARLESELRQSKSELRRTKAELRREREKNADLVALNAHLEEKLAAPAPDMTNSVTPSSKNPLNAEEKERKETPPESASGDTPSGRQGGVPGHPAKFRTPFRLGEADKIDSYFYGPGAMPPCPHCGSELVRDSEKDLQRDRYDLPEKGSLKKVELSYAYRCRKCGKIHYSRRPDGGFLGTIVSPAIVAEMLVLKSLNHMSIRQISGFYREWHGMDFCHSFVNKCLKQAAFVLMPVLEELYAAVPKEPALWVDETGYKLKDKNLEVWAFRGTSLVAYKIGPRTRKMLDSVIGPDFAGVLTCDFYIVCRSYLKDYPETSIQFCLAHQAREFQNCSDHKGKEFEDVREFGRKGTEILDGLFRAYGEHRKAVDDSPEAVQLRLGELFRIRDGLQAHALTGPQHCSKSRGIAERFRTLGRYYFTFLEIPGIQPTNNDAERILRGIVIERKMGFFTQSLTGICYIEVIQSILDTLRINGVNVKEYFVNSLTAGSEGKPLPSVVNPGQEVAPRFVEAADEKYMVMRELIAAMRKIGGVKPFLDDPEDFGKTDGKKGGRGTGLARKRKSRAIRPGSGPPKWTSKEPAPDGGPAGGGSGELRHEDVASGGNP
jgi:transposase